MILPKGKFKGLDLWEVSVQYVVYLFKECYDNLAEYPELLEDVEDIMSSINFSDTLELDIEQEGELDCMDEFHSDYDEPEAEADNSMADNVSIFEW